MDRNDRLALVGAIWEEWSARCEKDDPKFNPENPTPEQEAVLNAALARVAEI